MRSTARLLPAVADRRVPRRRVAARRAQRLARQRLVAEPRRVGLAEATPQALVVVNLGDVPAAGHVSLPWDDLRGLDLGARRPDDGRAVSSGAATSCATGSTSSSGPGSGICSSWRRSVAEDRPTPTAEHARLAEATGRAEDDLFAANPWYEWGPYLSERAWGTVREDYSAERRRLELVPARPRPLARLPLERGRDGRHLRHPPRALPRAGALERPRPDPQGADVRAHRARRATTARTSRSTGGTSTACRATRCCSGATTTRRPRSRTSGSSTARPRHCDDPEFELLDTGVFDDDRYWSVDVTYAKASPTEILARIDGREPRPGRGDARRAADAVVPEHVALGRRRRRARGSCVTARRSRVDRPPARRLPARGRARPGRRRRPSRCSATTRRTRARLFGVDAASAVSRRTGSTTTSSPAPPRSTRASVGTKAARRYRLTVPAGGRAELRLRLHRPDARSRRARLGGRRRSTTSSRAREAEADEFYAAPRARRAPTPRRCGSSARRAPGSSGASRCTRTACAAGSTATRAQPPPPAAHRDGRNGGWRHLDSFDVLAMPDPWEYPWFAAWDLAFHAVAVGAPRPGVRQVPARRAAPRVVPAPERRAARVRVELRRRQPAGPRAGRAARLPHRRRPRPRVPRAGLPEAAAQLHVVAQPPGPRRQQRLRRRLPRPRQHQPDRPLAPARRATRSSRPTARRGWPTTRCTMLVVAGRLAERERRLRRHGRQVPRAVRADRRARSTSRGSTTPRTASSTTAWSRRRRDDRRSRCRRSSG